MAIVGKNEAVKIIHECAVLYNRNLSGKNVLFVTSDNNECAYIETLFAPNNFLHLTGVKTKLNSEYFFKSALNQRLSPANIEFDPGGTTEIKLQVLPHLMSIHSTARMIGDYDNSRPLLVTDKFAGTVTMGFIPINGFYVPNTALKKDIRDITAQATRRKVAAIFVKNRSDAEYTLLTYIAKGLAVNDDALQSILRGKVDIQNITAAFPIPKK